MLGNGLSYFLIVFLVGFLFRSFIVASFVFISFLRSDILLLSNL
jgi:hypothetical protein